MKSRVLESYELLEAEAEACDPRSSRLEFISSILDRLYYLMSDEEHDYLNRREKPHV